MQNNKMDKLTNSLTFERRKTTDHVRPLGEFNPRPPHVPSLSGVCISLSFPSSIPLLTAWWAGPHWSVYLLHSTVHLVWKTKTYKLFLIFSFGILHSPRFGCEETYLTLFNTVVYGYSVTARVLQQYSSKNLQSVLFFTSTYLCCWSWAVNVCKNAGDLQNNTAPKHLLPRHRPTQLWSKL